LKDKKMPIGTRLYVEGEGKGTYVLFNRNRLGANHHTIAFDVGGRKVIELKSLKSHQWYVITPPTLRPTGSVGGSNSRRRTQRRRKRRKTKRRKTKRRKTKRKTRRRKGTKKKTKSRR
jgi:hypothetical protein